MEIELSEDLQHYKESFFLGLTVKQTFFSILALGTGTAIVLLLYNRIGVTLSCYVATPFVVPLALAGFYNYHGLTFWQFAGKMIYFAFFNRPLVYWSTESVEELRQISSEAQREEEKAEKRKKNANPDAGQKESRQGKTAGKSKKKKRQGDKTSDAGSRGKKIEEIENGTDKKRKRRRNKNMVTVTQKRMGTGRAFIVKRSPVGRVVMKAVGILFASAGLLAAGAAIAAVWYGRFR